MVETNVSEAERRFQLAPGQFPFISRFAEIDGARLHYIDEGSGPLLFMLHGNPTWSFVYRHLINSLRSEFRCVSLDLAGFGLSDAPPGFAYRPDEHTNLVAGFLESVNLREATLIAHDWGGPIGLAAMLKTSERITRLCLGNTWAWPVNGDVHFEWFSKLMGGPIGQFGSNHFAMFVNGLMPATMKRRKLTEEEMKAYRAPFSQGRSRSPMYIFPREITESGKWLGELEAGLSSFKGPVRFIWPNCDIAFRDKELRRWQEMFPQSSTVRLANCGHYLWEDAPEECIEAMRGWLNTTS